MLEVLLVGSAVINEGAVGENFNNSVCYGVYDFVVVRGEQNVALEALHTVVDGGYRLKVKVVRGLVDNKHI